jgi:hypothetical protein
VTEHLWEYDHPYYCNEANWHRNVDGTFNHAEWSSWAEFLDATIFVPGDRDMNFLVRWDWRRYKEGDRLQLAFVMQRKGYLATHAIKVVEENEPEIRDWLTKCAEHVRLTWEPLLEATRVSNHASSPQERVVP